MSFGWGVGDIISISQLAAKVCTAYCDAPDSYRHISEEVAALWDLIDDAQKHFKCSITSSNNYQRGQTVLKSCQSVLDDLNSLIEKYKSLASIDKTLVFQRVKLVTEDIATLRARLTSNATLLSSFIQK